MKAEVVTKKRSGTTVQEVVVEAPVVVEATETSAVE
jgi:hypothetical protein